MTEITTLREMRPAPTAAELEAMRTAARERFVAGTRSRRARQRWRLPVIAGGLTVAATATAAVALVLTSGPGAAPTHDGTAGSVGTTAWTVREDTDGTITINIRQFADLTALQQTLQADGINAIVRSIPLVTPDGNPANAYPACTYATTNDAPQAVQRAVVQSALPGPGPGSVPGSAGSSVHEAAAGSGGPGHGPGQHGTFIIHPSAMPQGSALFIASAVQTSSDSASGVGIGPVVLNNDTVPACVPGSAPTPPPLPASAHVG
jgi:hypothetical protein